MAQGIDDLDRAILRRLSQDARTPTSRIAKDIGLSNTACRARLKHLEERGYIDRYTILIDNKNTRFRDFQYVLVGLNNKSKIKIEEMCHFLCSMPNLVMLELIEGPYDLLAEFGIANNGEFNAIRERIQDHPLCQLIEAIYSIKAVRAYHIDIDQLI